MKPLLFYGHTRPVSHVMFSHDGQLLFTSGKDDLLIVWDAVSGVMLGSYEHKSAIFYFDVSRDSRTLASASADGVRLFDVGTGEMLTYIESKAIVRSCEWDHSPDGPSGLLVCSANFRNDVPQMVSIYDFDPSTRSLELHQSITEGLGGTVTQAIWGPFDESIIVFDAVGSITVLDSASGEVIKIVDDAHLAPIKRGCFTCDYRLLATCGEDMCVRIWNPVTWECIATFEQDRPLNDVKISPLYRSQSVRRQHVLAAGGQKASEVTTTGAQEGRFEALLLHLAQGCEMGRVEGHYGPVNCVAWRPDGLAFVTGGEEGMVRYNILDKEYVSDSYWD